jgi:hypothetical protein
MGAIVFFEVESGKECPYVFTTPARSLFEFVMEYQIGVGNFPNELKKIENYFHLNILPIIKMGPPEWELILEEFDMDEVQFNKERDASLALWQSPRELISCIQSILGVLREAPDIFSQLNISSSYFTKGFFEGNLVDLLKMAEWANENRESKVRLLVA